MDLLESRTPHLDLENNRFCQIFSENILLNRDVVVTEEFSMLSPCALLPVLGVAFV